MADILKSAGSLGKAIGVGTVALFPFSVWGHMKVNDVPNTSWHRTLERAYEVYAITGDAICDAFTDWCEGEPHSVLDDPGSASGANAPKVLNREEQRHGVTFSGLDDQLAHRATTMTNIPVTSRPARTAVVPQLGISLALPR